LVSDSATPWPESTNSFAATFHYGRFHREVQRI
jgi:hypothetical protein